MTRTSVERDSYGGATVIEYRETPEERAERQAARVAQRERAREVERSLRSAFDRGRRDAP